MPDILSKFQKLLELSCSRTDKQTNKVQQKHNLLGRGKYVRPTA